MIEAVNRCECQAIVLLSCAFQVFGINAEAEARSQDM